MSSSRKAIISDSVARTPTLRARLRPFCGDKTYCVPYRVDIDFASDEFGALSTTTIEKSGLSTCSRCWRQRSRSAGRLWVQITTATVGSLLSAMMYFDWCKPTSILDCGDLGPAPGAQSMCQFGL